MTATPRTVNLARYRVASGQTGTAVGEALSMLEFAPPTHLAHMRLICVDQSLAATGWVVLVSDAEGLRVLRAGSLLQDSKEFPRGHEGSLQRAVIVALHMSEVLAEAVTLTPLDIVLHETPPVGTAMARPEASLLGALGVRLAARGAGLPIATVQNQHSKKVLVNDGKATKKAWHLGLDPYPIAGRHLVTNEGQRDALCLAITHLADTALKEQS